uniref:C-SKI_SMAD_bind domain-containing protein n=1 Tax=Macrostomum lignano TaxID=282301 RepID=A0A1I8F862_9PLAT
QANPVLDSAGVHQRLGGVRRELLLGGQHLLCLGASGTPAVRAHATQAHGHLLPMGSHRTSCPGADVLPALPDLASIHELLWFQRAQNSPDGYRWQCGDTRGAQQARQVHGQVHGGLHLQAEGAPARSRVRAAAEHVPGEDLRVPVVLAHPGQRYHPRQLCQLVLPSGLRPPPCWFCSQIPEDHERSEGDGQDHQP